MRETEPMGTISQDLIERISDNIMQYKPGEATFTVHGAGDFEREIERYFKTHQRQLAEMKDFLRSHDSCCLDLGCGAMEVGKLVQSFFEIKNYIGVDAFPLTTLLESGAILDANVQFFQRDILETLRSLKDSSQPFIMMNNIDIPATFCTIKHSNHTISEYMRSLGDEAERVLLPGGYFMALGVGLIRLPNGKIIIDKSQSQTNYAPSLMRKALLKGRSFDTLKERVSSNISSLIERLLLK